MANAAPQMFGKRKSTVVLREQLVKCFAASEDLIAAAVENFEKQPERTLEARVLLTRQLLTIIDELLAYADWESSPFISQLLKPTREKRAQLVSFLEQSQGQIESEIWEIPVCPAACVPVYIFLYQSTGPDMQGWQNQLLDLSSHAISRPIYATEAACERSIRLNGYSMKDAYALLYLPSEYLLAAPKSNKVDKFGQELLQLRSSDIPEKCVQSFHYQGDTYVLRGDQLIKIEESMIHGGAD